MAGNVVSNVKKYYGGQVPVPGQGDSDGKVKVLVEKTATIELEGVQTEVELLYDSDDLTTPVTPQQLGQWTDENYLIAFKTKDDEGHVKGFILYGLDTQPTETDTLVTKAIFAAFKNGMEEPGASAYEFEMVEDSSTLARYLKDVDGELTVMFDKVAVEPGAQSDTLDNLIATDTYLMEFEVVHDEDTGDSYLVLTTEGLDEALDEIRGDIDYIIGALDELPSDEHGYFNSSLNPTPGDGTTESIIIDDFRIMAGRDVHGDSIEFVPTHQIDGVDFGEVYLNPGTYIFTCQYTLQWVGNPRGTFLPLVTNVGDRPFDFSYEHEDALRTTRIVTRTTRGKFSLNFPFDADTPPMGIWVKNLEIAQITSYNHAAVAHDSTLTGTGKLDDPLGVTPDVFGKVKNIPTSINQFRTGDVIPVDGPNGPAKMPKDDLLTETAQNALTGNVAPEFDSTKDYYVDDVVIYNGVQYRFLVDHPAGAWSSTDAIAWYDKSSITPSQRFATNNGTYKFIQKDFNQETNRLITPTWRFLFAGKGDTITITPATGLKVTVLKITTMGRPPIYYPQMVVADGNTDSYTFSSDSYYAIMVQKTDESSISLSDFGNTSIEVTQKLASDVSAQNISNFADVTKTDDSVIKANVPSVISDRYSNTPRKRKFSLLDLASRNGDVVFGVRDMVQISSIVRTEFFNVYAGDHIVFDGSPNSSEAVAYKVAGGTWTPVSGSGFSDYKSSFDYEAEEDFTCAVDIRIPGQTYSYLDYVYGTLRVCRAMSVHVLKKMQQDIASATGFGVLYPYARVKNGRLVSCDAILGIARADYLAVDMGGKVSKIACKWHWSSSNSHKATICMASMPDTWTKKISGTDGITGKALHITCTRTNLRVDFLGGDWGATYYTNLIDQQLDLSPDPTIEHAISATISGETVTIVLDGQTYTGTNISDKSMSDVVGKYAFIEHYNGQSYEEDKPEYTAFKVVSSNGTMYDSFARENGLCTMSPQGYPYVNVGTATASFPTW